MSPWSLDKSGSGFVFIEQWCTAYVSIWLRPSHCMFWLVTMTIGHVPSCLYHVWFLHAYIDIEHIYAKDCFVAIFYGGTETSVFLYKYLCAPSHYVFYYCAPKSDKAEYRTNVHKSGAVFMWEQ